MSIFRKVFNLKIISLLVAGLFILNSTTYGIDLSNKTHLRKHLDFNDDRGAISRYFWVLGGAMGRWKYDRATFDSVTGRLTLHNATRIPRKDGIVEEEFLIDGENKPRDIMLKTRRMNKTEITKTAGIEKELGLTISPRIIVRDVAAIKHRIYGVAAQGIPFIREDIVDKGNHDQIKEAFDHENRELTEASHDDIRRSQYQGYLRELIRSLSDKDKSADLSRVGVAFSGKLRTFEEYITSSLGREIEEIQEIVLFTMWGLYLFELDRTFADTSDFRQAYSLFYDVHARHLTEGKINSKSVKAYVPIIRRPFSSVKEVKDIVNVDTEWSIDFLPEPGSWEGPSLYGFILSVVDGQLHISFYDSKGLIREFNTDEATETALRTIGLIGNKGLIVLVRSSSHEQLKGFAVLGVGGRISLGGHSHPKESGAAPSDSHSLDDPADVELFALRFMGLPKRYPINKNIPAFAAREQAVLDEGRAKEKDQTETASQTPAKLSDNLYNMLGRAIARLKAFAGSQAGKKSPLPIDELVLYLKVLKAMYEETVGKYEGSGADHEYVHRYKAEFAGELAYHPIFQTEAQRMLEESFEGALRVLALQIPGDFIDEPGTLNRMMSIVTQLIEEFSTHPDLRERAIALINDPRAYGLGDIVLAKADTGTGSVAIEGQRSKTQATLTKGPRELIRSIKRRIAGTKPTQIQPIEKPESAKATDIVPTVGSKRVVAIAVRTQEFAAISDELFKAAEEGNGELRDELKPTLEDVVRARANRLLILADKSANDDPEIAEVALREYLRLVKTFGSKIDFYVAVTLDKYENIMNNQLLRPTLIETVRSVSDTKDRNNMLTEIAIQLMKEGDVQGSLDLLEEIGSATFYTFSAALEQLADLLLIPGERNERMVQQLERIIENIPVVMPGRRYDERKIRLFVKLGDKYDELGMRGKANSNYKTAWELSGKAEQPAVTRLEYFVPLMREKGLEFPISRTEIIEEARRIGESEILRNRLSGRPDTLIAVAREYAFNRDYEKAEEVAQYINDNMDYPRDHYDHCYGAIIEAAALHGDNERIDPAASKMTHYIKDHFECAAQLLVTRGEYQRAMELGNLAMKHGYFGSSTVGYWGSTQLRIARNILKKDSTQIEMVRGYLGTAISEVGIDGDDLEQVISMI
ncbi:MAG: hypothetical protein L6408_04875, partial [Nanoarchaeota archaeon]|nr:hypothetical protein [Nanoarchaeota archaeon]